MSARDGPEDDEPDVPEPDAPRELPSADDPAERPPPLSMDEPGIKGVAYAEYRQRAEGGWEPRRFEAPRAELERFDPERAGLPRMSLDAADSYIKQHRDTRPWLAVAAVASPEGRRIIVAMDDGGGHGHIRHEGWVTEWANMRRVACLEDPAQLDPVKRSLGVDGLRQNDRPHRCGDTATRIADPDAFATAFTRGVEHPKIREALNMAFSPRGRPSEVAVPIADLLGPDGHKYCTGWRLQPVDGSMDAARPNRDAWIAARDDGRKLNVREPRARPIPTFRGGDIVFAFTRNDSEKRYEVVTMFVRPAQQQASTSSPESPKEQRDVTVLLGTASRGTVRDAHRSRD